MLALAALWLAGFVVGAKAPPLPVVPPVRLSSAWATVGLPAEPLGMAENGGKLWVVGENEMIAESDDGGSHWVVRNLRRGGDMLFSISVPRPGTIAAFGSAGVWLESEDGGQSWKRGHVSPAASLTQVALFANGGGFALDVSDLGSTSDGGRHWRFVHVDLGRKAVDPLRLNVKLAARDGQHAAALISTTEKAAIVATSDGGKHWSVTPLDDIWMWTDLRPTEDGYALYGMHDQHVDLTPAVGLFGGGAGWHLGTAPPVELSGCNRQGCLTPAGWVDLKVTPEYWQLPKDSDQPLTVAWVAGASSFCRISTTLRCRTGREPWKVQVEPPVQPSSLVARCRQCPAPLYPPDEHLRREAGDVLLRAMIGADGKMLQVVPISAPTPGFAREAIDSVRRWQFTLSSPSPNGIQTSIWVSFRLGP